MVQYSQMINYFTFGRPILQQDFRILTGEIRHGGTAASPTRGARGGGERNYSPFLSRGEAHMRRGSADTTAPHPTSGSGRTPQYC